MHVTSNLPSTPTPASVGHPLSLITGGRDGTRPVSDRSLTSHRLAELEVQNGLATLLPDLHRRARFLTKNPDLALDLVQDTVERALRFAQGYEPGTNLRGWLLQIMYSVFASRCRRSQRHRAIVERLTSEPELWTSGSNAEPPPLPILSKALEAELHALPQSFAQVVCLIDIDELAYKEAATVLGIPVGTVMSRLHRARRLLRERLQQAA